MYDSGPNDDNITAWTMWLERGQNQYEVLAHIVNTFIHHQYAAYYSPSNNRDIEIYEPRIRKFDILEPRKRQ